MLCLRFFFPQNMEAWATIVALAWLDAKFCERKDDWLLLADKASDWLQQQDMEGKAEDVLKAEAQKLLGK